MSSSRMLLVGSGVVVLWASAFPAIRAAAPEFGPVGLAFLRIAIATAALLIVAPFAKVRMPAARDLPLIVACGLLGMVAYQVLLPWGEETVPAGTTSIIVSAAPLVSVAVAVLVFGEKIGWMKIAGSIVALGGVAVVSLAHSGLSLSGAIWIVVAAMVAQGLYHPLSKPLLAKYSGLELATYAMVVGTVVLLPAVPFSWHQISSASAPAWASIVYLGLLPSALGFVLWGYAVGRLPVATSTALLYLVPPVAILISFVWLGEIPFPLELLGGLIVLLGVAAVTLGDRLRPARKLVREL